MTCECCERAAMFDVRVYCSTVGCGVRNMTFSICPERWLYRAIVGLKEKGKGKKVFY